MEEWMGSTQEIVRRAVIAGYVVAGAGLTAIVTIGLFFWIGQPWGTINDLALIVMAGAIPFLMLAFWQLGGLTPTPLALVAQASGWLAVLAWCGAHLLFVLGVVDFDYFAPATGVLAVESVALIVIGLWIGGANLLAGPWLTSLRWLGVLTGAGIALYAVGFLLSGGQGMLTYTGAVAYLLLLPVWAFLMARHLSSLVRV
jgi:hypothetical protein